MATKTVARRDLPSPKVLASRRRAAARYRALARLAREYPDRYAQLYAEEREVSP